MRRSTCIRVLVAGLALWLGGCAWITRLVSTDIVVVSSTRSLREQVLGVYEHTAEEVYSLAGVRAVDPITGQASPPPPMTESERQVLEARRRMEFNADDVRTFKNEQFVGERIDGTLAFLPEHKQQLAATDPWLHDLVEEIVNQENEDRAVLFERILAVTPELRGEEGRQQLRAILADRYRLESAVGTQIEVTPGTWTTKGG